MLTVISLPPLSWPAAGRAMLRTCLRWIMRSSSCAPASLPSGLGSTKDAPLWLLMKWIKKQWEDAPRLAHAHAKPQTAPDADMVGSGGLVTGDPQGTPMIFREQWSENWTERVDSSANIRD
eukprot:504754-Pyramimonas_sp.AAC.1